MAGTYKAVKASPPDLAMLAIEAHGGLERWNRFSTVSVHGINGGVFWGAKGKAGVLGDVTVTVDTRNQKISHWPFGSSDRRSRFEPQRVALENASDKLVEELLQPRSSFKGHTFETAWNDLQLAYFAGCAMWTYINTPFFLARPGVESEELEPWQEAGETWRRLKVRFPADIATHSTEQTLYFDQKGLLKRHDYHVEISGGIGAAHYISELKEFSGIVFPTKHRIFGLQPDGLCRTRTVGRLHRHGSGYPLLMPRIGEARVMAGEVTQRQFTHKGEEMNMSSISKRNESAGHANPSQGAEATESSLRNAGRDEDIRRRAYEIYLERGEQPDRELEDWLQAERELQPALLARAHTTAG